MGFICTMTMTPPPNFGHFCVILEGWSQILPSTKSFRHEFQQSSAMATQKLEEKVQQPDEVVMEYGIQL